MKWLPLLDALIVLAVIGLGCVAMRLHPDQAERILRITAQVCGAYFWFRRGRKK